MVNYLQEIVKEKNHHQVALAILFVIYILFNIQMPTMVAEGVSSMVGTAVVVVVVVVVLD